MLYCLKRSNSTTKEARQGRRKPCQTVDTISESVGFSRCREAAWVTKTVPTRGTVPTDAAAYAGAHLPGWRLAALSI